MSVGLYDKALVDKIKGWITDPEVVILAPDEVEQLLRWKSTVANDKPISLPLIALSRDPDITIDLKHKRPMSYSGKTFNATTKVADHLNGIPMSLKYQLDIYTRYRVDADDYFREFVFQIVNHPKMTIQIPYNDSNLEQDSFIELEGTITDASSIPERLVQGQFTRYSIPILVKDAYLFSYTTKTIPSIVNVGIQSNKKLYDKTPDFSNDLEFENIT